jgi:sugar/nucleoside kinase (ribokinase family)
MRTVQVYGIGNALVDLVISLNDSEFRTLDFKKGSMVLVDGTEQDILLERFGERDLTLCSGGSVANSIIMVAELGGSAAFTCCLGDDRFGHAYRAEFSKLGIRLHDGVPSDRTLTTGTCVSLVTPDSERTMRTCLGTAQKTSAAQLNAATIADAHWIFVEGYLLANGEDGQGAAKEMIRVARQSKTKVAFTCSEAFIPEVFGNTVHAILPDVDLLFVNLYEAQALTKTSSADEAFASLVQRVPNVVLTRGAEGAMIAFDGDTFAVPAIPCIPVDLTGAGDAFAGAFLYAVNNGFSARDAAKGAASMAMHVITKYGARLHSDVRALWSEALAPQG